MIIGLLHSKFDNKMATNLITSIHQQNVGVSDKSKYIWTQLNVLGADLY